MTARELNPSRRARRLGPRLRDDLADRPCRAVGWVKAQTRLDEVLQLCFEECEFSLPGAHIVELAGEQRGDVRAGSFPGLAEGEDTADLPHVSPAARDARMNRNREAEAPSYQR